MAYSYKNYVGDGETVNYSVTFPYIQASHVKVYVNGILKSSGTHYSWLNTGVIQFVSAPAENAVVTIMRDSSRDERMVDFVTGSLLDEATLDLDSNQLFYLMQEAFDWVGKAEDTEGFIFTDTQAIIDVINNNLTFDHLASELQKPINYLKDYWLSDAVFEEATYDYGVHAQGTARIDLMDAQITLLAEMFEEGGGDFGTRLTQCEVDIDANTASIVQTVIQVETNEGDITYQAGQIGLLQDEYYVKLDNNGNVAGFGLYNDATGSAFVVNVDKFGIIKADGGGTVKYPFTVDTETGIVAIDGSLLVSGSITADALNVGCIEATHISAGSIESAGIALGAVTEAKVATGAITSTKIGTNAIETGHLSANCVTADEITAGAVTATKISVSTLSAIAANVGTLTSGLLKSSDDKVQLDLTNKWLKVWDASSVLRVHLGYIP